MPGGGCWWGGVGMDECFRPKADGRLDSPYSTSSKGIGVKLGRARPKGLIHSC